MDLKEPSFGRTMLWEEGSPNILTTESYRDESIRSDIVRVRNHLDEAVMFAGGLYVLSNISE